MTAVLPIRPELMVWAAGDAALPLVFASADSVGTVTLWSLRSLSPLAQCRQHAAAVSALLQPPIGAVAAAPERLSSRLVSVGSDGSISVYEVTGSPHSPPLLTNSESLLNHL